MAPSLSVITATGVNAPSVTCRVKRVRDHGEISASRVRAGGNWQPASAIRNARKGSSSPITAARSVITTAARAKVRRSIAIDRINQRAIDGRSVGRSINRSIKFTLLRTPLEREDALRRDVCSRRRSARVHLLPAALDAGRRPVHGVPGRPVLRSLDSALQELPLRLPKMHRPR